MYDAGWDRQSLLFKIKLLQDRVEAFENGEQYLRMKKLHKVARDGDFRTISRLKAELEQERAEKIRVRENWYGTCEDIIKEYERRLAQKDREYRRSLRKKDALIGKLQAEIQKLEEKYGAEHEKCLRQLKQAYEAKTLLEEEREKNKALTARIGKDYTNSSKSSSLSPNHKTIHNSREKSGRRPGGQPGHVHHGRKRQEPTASREIPAPKEYLEDPDFKPTGKIVRKQLIKVHVVTEVIEYWTPEFRNVTTGQRVHADFPPGIVDDVNYDGTVKALAYMINNDLYTSINKTRVFLKDVSKGKIDISNGFICNLAKQFSDCTKEERDDIFRELMAAPVLHGDFTFGRACGKQAAVIISVTDDGKVLYQGREKKGNEGVKGSPIEHYNGTFVSDNESALARHGSRHQECMTHIQRYMKGSMENEPGRKWAREMHDWISESIDYRDKVCDGAIKYDVSEAERRISRFMGILEKGRKEYEDEPPSEYYRDGYNTFKRMEKSPEEYVLFLRDTSVPPTNNIAERAARKFKRKSHQVMSFRSKEGAEHFCDGLSITESIKAKGKNLFEEMTARFNKKNKEWL